MKEKEDKVFNNLFIDAKDHERVKYGAINILNHPEGVAPLKGYGRSYFILKDHVKPRCTISYKSCLNTMGEFGTFHHFYHILLKFTNEELKKTFVAARDYEVSWENFLSYN